MLTNYHWFIQWIKKWLCNRILNLQRSNNNNTRLFKEYERGRIGTQSMNSISALVTWFNYRLSVEGLIRSRWSPIFIYFNIFDQNRLRCTCVLCLYLCMCVCVCECVCIEWGWEVFNSSRISFQFRYNQCKWIIQLTRRIFQSSLSQC